MKEQMENLRGIIQSIDLFSGFNKSFFYLSYCRNFEPGTYTDKGVEISHEDFTKIKKEGKLLIVFSTCSRRKCCNIQFE
jgi:hypothetical protein